MFLHRRKNGSQRSSTPIKLTLEGSELDRCLTFRDEQGGWYLIEIETETEMRQFLSAAHIAHHYWGVQR